MGETGDKKARSAIYLVITALVWGLTFSAQSAAMDNLGPLSFYMARSYIGALSILPFAIIYGRRAKKLNPGQTREEKKKQNARLWKAGLLCGAVMAVSSLLQQFGMVYTTVGKASFITALYIIFVPLIGGLLGRRVRAAVWVSVAIAAVGLWLLCMNGGFSISKGDFLVLLCGVMFAVHILVVDRVCNSVNPVALSAIQFAAAGTIALVGMLIFERPTAADFSAALLPTLYAGIMSTGLAYTLQIIGQRDTDPTVAALIMSLESVFGAIGGWLVLGQGMSRREIAGGALVFIAVILAQIPQKWLKPRKKS